MKNFTVYMDDKEIKVKNEKTEITVDESAISVLAPVIILESGKCLHQFL